MSPDTLEQPTTLGNYDVLAKIAEGGMGTVYKAKRRVTGEVVAVKVICPGPARNPVVLQRFEREFAAAKVLDHPNLVRAIEYCGSGPHPFLVMEFVEGESIGQRIERAGAMPEHECIAIVAQICDGLQCAHKQGLVHRDVKPDNILLTPDGTAKLTDMGLVKEVEGDLNLTKTGRGLGTPHYMAPEQFRNAKGVDVRGDVYSLGATLYAMITGTVPFANSNPLECWMRKIRNEFPSPKELRPEIADRMDWAIRRAMSAEPNQRPATCREFLEDVTGHSRLVAPRSAKAAPHADIWYMVYKDETGQPHTVKGATEGIRNALRDGLLGDAATILVGRSKTGQFTPIGSVAEFRDLVVVPAQLAAPGRSGSGGANARRSGVTPRPAGEDSVDLDASAPPAQSTSNTPTGGPMPTPSRTAPPSGRHTSLGAPKPPSATHQVTIPTQGVASSHAETVDFGYSTPLPDTTSRSAPHAVPDPLGRSLQKPPFDWTPILMILVALLSTLVGIALFMRPS